ncbi:hypothetical protein [Pontibacter sp. G13]|uniref:hypothetical protein n=1 Tax=Pontibacter sp. G13 TaxID=3074898 RepID=UPI00288AC354|nr:hypothetical protein [Pontibacter sp. G13]WNJ21615.1 hypothetical protein RJD25_28860 [Pontibacter sp. G13]
MNELLTYSRIRIVAAVLILVIGYGAFQHIWHVAASIPHWQRAALQLQRARAAPELLAEQQQLLAQHQTHIRQLQRHRISLGDASTSGAYLEALASQYHLQLVSWPYGTSDTLSGHILYKEQFTLAGPFRQILGMLNQIEQHDRMGHVHAIHFELKRVRTGRKIREELVVEIGLRRLGGN